MNWWYFIVPVLSAFISWLMVSLVLRRLFHPQYPKKMLGYAIQGWLPKNKTVLAAEAGRVSAAMFSMGELEEKITHPDNVKNIMPQAEAHIDNFLRVKLVKSMPVVGMFVGDKTINNLKALFITELEELFPVIMKKYMSTLQQDIDIEKIVREKISAMPVGQIETAFFHLLKKELALVKWLGALLGFLIGLLQIGMLLLLPH